MSYFFVEGFMCTNSRFLVLLICTDCIRQKEPSAGVLPVLAQVKDPQVLLVNCHVQPFHGTPCIYIVSLNKVKLPSDDSLVMDDKTHAYRCVAVQLYIFIALNCCEMGERRIGKELNTIYWIYNFMAFNNIFNLTMTFISRVDNNIERRAGWINVGDLASAVHFKIVKYERIKFLVIALR